MPIQEARDVQNHIQQTLKKASWKSRIDGNKDRVLWSLPHRSAEMRNKIKAIIATKELLVSLSTRFMPGAIVQVDWRDRVYRGKSQVVSHGDDEKPGDGALLQTD